MIEVCCAIIRKGECLLAVQKGPESSMPMKWEFPGGKINKEETPEACIIREIGEELCVDLVILQRLKSVEFHYPEKSILLVPFLCEISSRQLTLTEHIDIKWFMLPEWRGINWAAADQELILKNLDLLQNLLVNPVRENQC